MARLGRAQPFKPLIRRVRGTMSFSATLSETVTMTDTLLKQPGKVLSDTITYSDTLLTRIPRMTL